MQTASLAVSNAIFHSAGPSLTSYKKNPGFNFSIVALAKRKTFFQEVNVPNSTDEPTLLQSAEPDYAALNLHRCRDTCHIRLGGKGNAWLEGFLRLLRTFHASFVRGAAAEAVG